LAIDETLEVTELESRSALTEYLEGQGCRHMLLGEHAEAPRKFYSIAIDRNGMRACVGIISSHFGIGPVAACLDERIVMVGYDNFVTAIDPAEAAEVFSLRLWGPFYCFIASDRRDAVVVVHEVGLLKLSQGGETLWSVDTDDIVEAAQPRDDHSVVKIWGNAEPMLISVGSGQILQRD
jgi:hypothetical protein